ncbi:MAG TPA: acetyl-CoA carboxylase biotin carboxyl carrier protein [Xanthobacteraceae bacterium]|jgi:acetyl-CoA carboxylase biotin carboxyl carrier protein|nr:acetyl-CoA carboxylase biotin carboxyl carrier protein [Xanthobacteraceae bacterium]
MSKEKSAIDQQMIRELASLLDENSLTEIEIERSGLRIRVARHQQTTAHIAHAPAAAIMPTAPVIPVAVSASLDPAKNPGAVASPMVGTAYRAAEPGGKPFIEVGSKVKAGDTLLIIEAMKTMNQIPAPRGGTIIQILFEDSQPVEYGEPLVIIE